MLDPAVKKTSLTLTLTKSRIITCNDN